MHKKILITGGGSGGHISSANSLIETLLDSYRIAVEDIVYVGGDLGMENEKPGNSLEQKLMSKKAFKSYFIRAGKLQRTFSLTTIKLLLRSILGFIDSFKILKSEHPDLVISTGGFVSVPVCIVSWLFKVPIFLHEQTASVGLSNKIVGVLSKKVYVSFKDSLKYFKEGKAIHVGNNVRKAIFKKDITEESNKEIVQLVNSKGELPFIYISGGSLGSHILNMKVLKELTELLEKYTVLLQTGDNQKLKEYDLATEYHSKLDESLKKRFLPIKYIDENSIGYVLNSMDIFVGRSGANTVYEIGVLKKNALFIPIPWVTNNEQYLNAKVLENIGTAKILEEKYLDSTTLCKEIERLEEQLKIRDINEEKLESLFPINANSKMIEDIFSNEIRV